MLLSVWVLSLSTVIGELKIWPTKNHPDSHFIWQIGEANTRKCEMAAPCCVVQIYREQSILEWSIVLRYRSWCHYGFIASERHSTMLMLSLFSSCFLERILWFRGNCSSLQCICNA